MVFVVAKTPNDMVPRDHPIRRIKRVVEEVLIEDECVVGIKGGSKGAATVTDRARVVVGADGRHSLVAEAVRPERYNEKPPLLAAYYTYWSGLPMDGRFETYIRPHRGFAAAPTHNGLTLTVGGWPYSEFETNKKDVEGNFLKSFDLAPEFVTSCVFVSTMLSPLTLTILIAYLR